MAKRLNERQLAAVAILAQPKRGGLTLEQVAEQVGVSRQTLHEWRKDATFGDELKKEIVRNTLDDLPAIMQSIPQHIINDGNAALFRTLLQAHGMLTDKVEVANVGAATDAEAIKAEIAKLRR